jgi:hypothetical protein
VNQRVRLYERKGVWWAAWTANRKTVRRSTRTRTEAEARATVESWGDLPASRDVLRDAPGRVYFVEAVGLGLVKIGFTRVSGMDRRMEHLRCYCPVEIAILGGYHGNMLAEREEHRRWAADRVRGEWFRKSEALAAHILDVSEWAPRRDPLANHRPSRKTVPGNTRRTRKAGKS